MRKNGKYKFTLQFGAHNEEQIRVGELLEKLGNKKSAVIVAALSEYLNSHPELQSDNEKIEVRITSSFNQLEIEKLIKSIVEQKLSDIQLDNISNASKCDISEATEDEITQMLNNLNMFN